MQSAPTLAIKRFFTTYKPDPKDPGKVVGVDMVEYGPIGSLDRSTTVKSIRELSALQPLANGDNPAVAMAHARWNTIQPAYEAWKRGQELPDEGTPLGAWNAIGHEQAEVLRINGIRTVEDLTQITDAHIIRIPLPNLRELKRQAQLYVESADQRRVAAKLDQKDSEVSALQEQNELQKAQMEEQKKQIEALLAKVNQMADMLVEREAGDEGEQPARRKKAAA